MNLDIMDGLEVFDDIMPIAPQARFSDDHKLFVQFYKKAVANEFESKAQNRPVFDEKDYIRIIIPGDKNSEIDTPVDEHYKLRFAEKYRAFQAGKSAKRSGTPLEAWPIVTLAQVAEMKSLNITMVEDIVNCPDSLGQKIMGYQDLKRKATAFLEASGAVARENAIVDKVASRLSRTNAA